MRPLSPTQQATIKSCLSSVFNKSIEGVDDATQVYAAFLAVVEASRCALSDDLSAWNVRVARRLPAEVLACCFEFLPLIDRITASHVCHHWRFAALHFPAVWARIDVETDEDYSIELLDLALSRARAHTIDLTFTGCRWSGFKFAPVLAEHMHHIKTIDWCGELDSECFLRPAPKLTWMRCNGGEIGSNFLGGVQGALRELIIDGPLHFEGPVPPLAFRTITRLQAALFDEDADMSMLFDACPRLEVLDLRNIDEEINLPRGPSPKTLRELQVEVVTCSNDFSDYIFNILQRWEVKRIAHVALFGMRGDVLNDMPCVFVSCTRIIGTDPTSGKTRVLMFRREDNDRHSPNHSVERARFIRDAIEAMARRADISVSSHALSFLCRVKLTFPASLRALTLIADTDVDTMPTDSVWTSLFAPSAALERITFDYAGRNDVLNLFTAVPWAHQLATGRCVRELYLHHLPYLEDPFYVLRYFEWCERLVVEPT